MLSVLKYPHPALRVIASRVTKFNDDLRKLVNHMHETITHHKGAGLAAPQVGHPICLVVIPEHISNDRTVFINPAIIKTSEQMEEGDEGCLSFPDIFIKLRRCTDITVKAQNLQGHEFTSKASGFYARALQHEIDHLGGILLIHRAGSVQRDIIKRKMKKWKNRS